MAQRIEIQRLKLLRLLAGWLALISLLSIAPIAPAWTRWVRGFVFSVLRRAEVAAQCLLLTQACLIARARGEAVDAAWRLRPQVDLRSAYVSDDEEPPLLAELWHRIIALRCLLENLHRRGLRLLRRLQTVCAPCVVYTLPRLACLFAAILSCPSKRWRPPDKAFS